MTDRESRGCVGEGRPEEGEEGHQGGARAAPKAGGCRQEENGPAVKAAIVIRMPRSPFACPITIRMSHHHSHATITIRMSHQRSSVAHLIPEEVLAAQQHATPPVG